MKRRSSLRRTAAPIPVALMVFALPGDCGCASLFGGFARCAAATHGARARGNRFDDVVIAGATANIAFKLLADGAVVEVIALAADDVDGSHDHARRAKTALQTMVFAECFLHRMERTVGRRQSLDREHIGSFELQRQNRAGFDRLAVDMHDTGAALRSVTADMRAGKPQVFA